MVLKKKKYFKQVEGKKEVLILSFISSIVSFVGVFFGLLPITMNAKGKKAEYIANLMNESVDEQTAEMMFNIFNGIFRYILVISIIILIFGLVTLFLLEWVLDRENKKKIGYVVYLFGIVHLFSFRLIGSFLFYRQAIKFIMGGQDQSKVKN